MGKFFVVFSVIFSFINLTHADLPTPAPYAGAASCVQLGKTTAQGGMGYSCATNSNVNSTSCTVPGWSTIWLVTNNGYKEKKCVKKCGQGQVTCQGFGGVYGTFGCCSAPTTPPI